MKLSIAKIETSSGQEIPIPENALVIFVGPNNVGKSTALTDINRLMGTYSDDTKVIKKVLQLKEGSAEDLIEWLDKHTEKQATGTAPEDYNYIRDNGQTLSPDGARHHWGTESLVSIWPFLSLFLDASTRQNNTTTGRYDPMNGYPIEPLHFLLRDEKKRNKLSQIAEEVFDTPLTLNPHGSNLQLHLGAVNLSAAYPEKSTIEQLKKMPLLDSQGHGMKSFMYLVLRIMVQDSFIILVDEPEVFLHPPQALALGKRLRTATTNRQVFASTHSSDILRGALSQKSDNPVVIVRLTKNDGKNYANVLDPNSIKKLWSDPIARYSNLLDGLFHHTTIICEGDGDCKFYSAILDRLPKDSGHYSAEDLHFTYTSGKSRMAIMAASLRAAGIRVRSVADIDLLRKDDIKILEKLITAHGGKFDDETKKHLRVVNSAIDSLDQKLTQEFVKQEVTNVINEFTTGAVDKDARTRINNLLRASTGWDQIKRAGKNGIPPGDGRKSFDWLTQKLESYGIFIVEVGEMECFVPQIGKHGPGWLADVLEQELDKDAAKSEAGQLVERLSRKN